MKNTTKLNKNIYKKSSKINQYNIFFVNLQIIFTVIIIIFGVVYIFKPSFSKWFELFLGIDLLVMAYNNQMIYRKKNLTIVYTVVGGVIMIISFFKFLGVAI